MVPLIRRILFSFTSLAGVAALAMAGKLAYDGHQVRTWPTATGVVESATVSEETRSRRGRIRQRYKPVISYRYEVDGREYRSDRRSPLSGWDLEKTPDAAQEVLARFAVGTEVTVHHDPDDPARAALEAGFDRAIEAATAGGVLIVVSILGFALTRRSSRAETS